MADFFDSTFLPSGADWADGLDGRPGTPTPDEAELIVPGSFLQLEEEPTSPDIERGEQGTIQHKFRVDYDNGLVYISALSRGTFMVDSFGNTTKILTARLVKQKGNTAMLTVTAESISFDSPPDEFNLAITELNPAIEKHPRYGFIPPKVRQMVLQSVSSATQLSIQDATNSLDGIYKWDPIANPPPAGATWALVQKAAKELLLKKRIGEDTFYLPGFTVTWSQFFFGPQFLNPGGYIEDPIDGGGLPFYFWSTDQTPFGDSIFDKMQELNPQFYTKQGDQPAISWLRMADHVQYERTWFKVTHTWNGAPYAHWDSELYNQLPSPYPPAPPFPIA